MSSPFDGTGLILGSRRNLVAGTKYLEIVGEMIITSSLTPMRAVIIFKEGSSWGGSGSRNKIEGRILDGNGELVVELTGRWDEQIDRKKGERDFERVWSVNEFPKSTFSPPLPFTCKGLIGLYRSRDVLWLLELLDRA